MAVRFGGEGEGDRGDAVEEPAVLFVGALFQVCDAGVERRSEDDAGDVEGDDDVDDDPYGGDGRLLVEVGEEAADQPADDETRCGDDDEGGDTPDDDREDLRVGMFEHGYAALTRRTRMRCISRAKAIAVVMPTPRTRP